MVYRVPVDQDILYQTLDAATPGMVVNLRDRDLSACDLQAPELRAVLVRITEHNRQAAGRAQMIVDFSNSDISGLNLDQLYLTGFIMTRAVARHTIFTQSDLSDVLLDGADASHADFRYAVLRYTKLQNTQIDHANFAGADLTSTYGLSFNMADQPQKAAERLSVVQSLLDAQLPDHVEAIRTQLPPHQAA